MRRQSLRPRQIDVHARMRIIRSEEDLDLDDDSGGGGNASGAGGSSQSITATFEELVGVRRGARDVDCSSCFMYVNV